MVDKNLIKSDFIDTFAVEPDGFGALGTPLILVGETANITNKKAIILNSASIGARLAYRKRKDRAFRVAINKGPIIEFAFFDLNLEAQKERNPYRKAILAVLVSCVNNNLLFDGLDVYIDIDADLRTNLFMMFYLSAITYAIDVAFNRGQSLPLKLVKIVYDTLPKANNQLYSMYDLIGIFSESSIVDFSGDTPNISSFKLEPELGFCYLDLKEDDVNISLRQKLLYELKEVAPRFKGDFDEEKFTRKMSMPAETYDGEILKLRAQFCYDEYHLADQLLIANANGVASSIIDILKDVTKGHAVLLSDNGAFNYEHSYRKIFDIIPQNKAIAVLPVGLFSGRALLVYLPNERDFVLDIIKDNGFDPKEINFNEKSTVNGIYETLN